MEREIDDMPSFSAVRPVEGMAGKGILIYKSFIFSLRSNSRRNQQNKDLNARNEGEWNAVSRPFFLYPFSSFTISLPFVSSLIYFFLLSKFRKDQ